MMWGQLRNFLSDEDGLTVVEYVVSAALLAVVLTTVYSFWGNMLVQGFSSIFA
jgi:pilus assembly protein Flp/PilA